MAESPDDRVLYLYQPPKHYGVFVELHCTSPDAMKRALVTGVDNLGEANNSMKVCAQADLKRLKPGSLTERLYKLGHFSQRKIELLNDQGQVDCRYSIEDGRLLNQRYISEEDWSRATMNTDGQHVLETEKYILRLPDSVSEIPAPKSPTPSPITPVFIEPPTNNHQSQDQQHHEEAFKNTSLESSTPETHRAEEVIPKASKSKAPSKPNTIKPAPATVEPEASTAKLPQTRASTAKLPQTRASTDEQPRPKASITKPCKPEPSTTQTSAPKATPVATPNEPEEDLWCTCRRPEGTQYGAFMIGCENEACPTEWFHNTCVGVAKEPKKNDKWWCSDKCRAASGAASVKTKKRTGAVKGAGGGAGGGGGKAGAKAKPVARGTKRKAEGEVEMKGEGRGKGKKKKKTV